MTAREDLARYTFDLVAMSHHLRGGFSNRVEKELSALIREELAQKRRRLEKLKQREKDEQDEENSAESETEEEGEEGRKKRRRRNGPLSKFLDRVSVCYLCVVVVPNGRTATWILRMLTDMLSRLQSQRQTLDLQEAFLRRLETARQGLLAISAIIRWKRGMRVLLLHFGGALAAGLFDVLSLAYASVRGREGIFLTLPAANKERSKLILAATTVFSQIFM
eukprot:g39.t1